MIGYLGYVKLTDGVGSVELTEASKVVIYGKDKKKMVVMTRVVDKGAKASYSYSGRYSHCIAGYRKTDGGKLVQEDIEGQGYRDRVVNIPYRKGSRKAIHGVIVRRQKLGKDEGVCRTRYSCGAFKEQAFYYANGACAYKFKKSDTKVLVRYPDGLKRLEFETPDLHRIATQGDRRGELRRGFAFFAYDLTETGEADFKLTHYDRKGRVKTHIEQKDRQRTGKLVKNYKPYYFLNGIEVPKKLYDAKPEDLDAKEVLKIDNAQLRMMMVQKIGLERVVKECEGKVIDRHGKNALYDFPVRFSTKGRFVGAGIGRETDDDRFIRVLKVVCPSTDKAYFLRVPVDEKFARCETARQGTFNGFELDAKPIKFAVET